MEDGRLGGTTHRRDQRTDAMNDLAARAARISQAIPVFMLIGMTAPGHNGARLLLLTLAPAVTSIMTTANSRLGHPDRRGSITVRRDSTRQDPVGPGNSHFENIHDAHMPVRPALSVHTPVGTAGHRRQSHSDHRLSPHNQPWPDHALGPRRESALRLHKLPEIAAEHLHGEEHPRWMSRPKPCPEKPDTALQEELPPGRKHVASTKTPSTTTRQTGRPSTTGSTAPEESDSTGYLTLMRLWVLRKDTPAYSTPAEPSAKSARVIRIPNVMSFLPDDNRS